MKMVLKVLSLCGLGLTLLPSIYVFADKISWRTHTQLMFAGMILWFITAPFWMNKEDNGDI